MFLHRAFVIFLTVQSEGDTTVATRSASDRSVRIEPLATANQQQEAAALRERIVDWRWFSSE